MPRLALLLLCAAYLMPGLLGRGPWKSADIASYGYMAELARGGEGLARWSDPLLLGLRPDMPALLPYWLGALAIKVAPGWITPDLTLASGQYRWDVEKLREQINNMKKPDA